MTNSHAHSAAAARIATVGCAVITVSDTRTEANDTGGQHIISRLREEGHDVKGYQLVPDSPSLVQKAISDLAREAGLVLLSGGTGISRRDNTHEAVRALLDKEIPGFGELFRSLSYQEIGAAAMLSRAIGGIYRGTVVFSMPGALPAIRLAMEKLIVPEIRHLVSELRKHRT